jgi:hypothetical protein
MKQQLFNYVFLLYTFDKIVNNKSWINTFFHYVDETIMSLVGGTEESERNTSESPIKQEIQVNHR